MKTPFGGETGRREGSGRDTITLRPEVSRVSCAFSLVSFHVFLLDPTISLNPELYPIFYV
jgi:hypothetical protein